jgi:pimeloyl-ACP methyl ester carboxylesterase
LFNRRQVAIQAELLNDRISWLKLPILIVQGERDRSIATAFNQVYAQAPNAKFHLIPDADEQLLETSPEAIAQEIQDFLNITDW